MTATLKSDIWDQKHLDRCLGKVLARTDPLYGPAMSVIRRCNTMAGAISTMARVRQVISGLRDSGVDPLHATRDNVQDWLASTRGRLSPETLGGYLGAARALYEEAIEADLISRNPTRRLRVGRHKPPRVPALTLDDVTKMLNAIDAELGDPKLGLVAARDRFIFTLGFGMGPRASEMLRLTAGDFRVEGEPPVAHIFGKNRQHELKRAPVVIIEAYHRYVAALEAEIHRPLDPDDALLIPLSHSGAKLLRDDPSRRLEPMSRAALYSICRNRLRDIGLTGIKLGSHRLRKTAATLMWQAKVDPREISRTLSHADISTTFRNYIAPAEELATAAGDMVAWQRPE